LVTALDAKGLERKLRDQSKSAGRVSGLDCLNIRRNVKWMIESKTNDSGVREGYRRQRIFLAGDPGR
jgi:hypothetical protein